MRLAHELLLPYTTGWGIHSLCHIRIYEQPREAPVAIAGELDDNPGTSITNAIETIALAVHTGLVARREFVLIEYYPTSYNGDPKGRFSRVWFNHRFIEEPAATASRHSGQFIGLDTGPATVGTPNGGQYRDPAWTHVDDITEIIRCPVKLWPKGGYAAADVDPTNGEAIRAGVIARSRLRYPRPDDAPPSNYLVRVGPLAGRHDHDPTTSS